MSFPLKAMIAILKNAKKYMDIMYLDTDGNIRGRSEDGLGEFFIVPALYEDVNQMEYLTPLAFNTKEFLDGIKDLKARSVMCWKSDKTLYVTDESEKGTTAMAEIPNQVYRYSDFVEHVWKKCYKYNYRELDENEMNDLKDYKATVLDAFYYDDREPIQIIVSGKDFNLVRLLGISIAAVDKDTEYQERCNHNHVIMKIQYKECDVFMLCGVV